MKYREITELTKAEISSIVEEIFKPLEIKEISPTRDDVLVPGALLRDSEGNIIGANGLSL